MHSSTHPPIRQVATRRCVYVATHLYSAQSLGINGATPSLHHTSLRYGELWRTKIHAQDLKNYQSYSQQFYTINPLKPELNSICYLLALLGAHHFLHVSRIRVKLLTLR